MKKTFLSFAIFLVILCLAGGGSYFWFKQESKVKSGTVTIFDGASTKQIAQLLEANHIIKNGNVFYYYIRVKSLYYEKRHLPHDQWYPVSFRQGTYHVNNGTFDSLIVRLNKAEGLKNTDYAITIPEGKGIDYMADAFEKAGMFKKDDFLKAVNDPTLYNQFKQKYTWLPDIVPGKRYLLEGYLQANTYHFPIGTPISTALDQMLSETNQWYMEYSSAQRDLTFNQVLTMASIVEAEAKLDSDRPKIAQVFYNRIAQGMPLESDMTAAYANGQHKVFMYNSDISVNSPYNTYKVKGLPIGPINSPSKASFEAVLTPSGPSFNDVYFYARPNGQTFFEGNLEDHQKDQQKYEHEWKELEKKK